MLQGNMTLLIPGKPWIILELTLSNQRLERIAPQIIFEDLFPVKPMLDVTVSDDYAHLVVLADCMERLICRSNQAIKSARRGFRVFSICVLLIIQHLHFWTRFPGLILVFRDEIDHPTVAAGSHTPFKF